MVLLKIFYQLPTTIASTLWITADWARTNDPRVSSCGQSLSDCAAIPSSVPPVFNRRSRRLYLPRVLIENTHKPHLPTSSLTRSPPTYPFSVSRSPPSSFSPAPVFLRRTYEGNRSEKVPSPTVALAPALGVVLCAAFSGSGASAGKEEGGGLSPRCPLPPPAGFMLSPLLSDSALFHPRPALVLRSVQPRDWKPRSYTVDCIFAHGASPSGNGKSGSRSLAAVEWMESGPRQVGAQIHCVLELSG